MVRGYTPISALVKSFSVCQHFLTEPLQLGHKDKTLIIKIGHKKLLKKSAWPTHPICLLVDGAWVMTELDWGEGRACWITMLVSWLPIREWECWCWPWPAWPCSEMFYRQESREESKQWLGNFKECNLLPSKLNLQHDSGNYHCLALGFIHLAWMGNEGPNYHPQAFSELSWGNIESLMKTRFLYCYLPSRTVCCFTTYIPK